MPPVPACQALSRGKWERSTLHRSKFIKPGEKRQRREGGLNFRVACTSPALPLPFQTQTHVVSTWQTYIYNAHCLKTKLFLTSATCLSLGFHLAWFVFQTGMSENSGNRNILGNKSLGKILQRDPGCTEQKGNISKQQLGSGNPCPDPALSPT